MKKLTIISCALLIGLSNSANSQTINPKFVGNVGVVSDYVFRGITQNRENTALQANFDVVLNDNFKVGIWGSNVNFNNNSNASEEFDFYGSYKKTYNQITPEIGLVHYLYSGAKSSLNYDYDELFLNLAYDLKPFTITPSFNYSPNFFAASGEAFYPRLTIDTKITKAVSWQGWIGRQYVQHNQLYGVSDYNDWAASLAYAWQDFTFKASYFDSNIKQSQCLDGCDSKLVLSINKSF